MRSRTALVRLCRATLPLMALGALACDDQAPRAPTQAPPATQGSGAPGTKGTPGGRAPYVPDWEGPSLGFQVGVPVSMRLGYVDDEGKPDDLQFEILPPPPHRANPDTTKRDTTAVAYPPQAALVATREAYDGEVWTVTATAPGMAVLRINGPHTQAAYLVGADSLPDAPVMTITPTTVWGQEFRIPLGGVFSGGVQMASRHGGPWSVSVSAEGDGIRLRSSGAGFTVAGVAAGRGTIHITASQPGDAVAPARTMTRDVAVAVVMPELSSVGDIGTGPAFSVPAGIRVPMTLGAVGAFGADGMDAAPVTELQLTVTSGGSDLAITSADAVFAPHLQVPPDFFVTAARPATYTLRANGRVVFVNPPDLGGLITVPLERTFTFSATPATAVTLRTLEADQSHTVQMVAGLPTLLNVALTGLPGWAAIESAPELAAVLPIPGVATPSIAVVADTAALRAAAQAAGPRAAAVVGAVRPVATRMTVFQQFGPRTSLAARAMRGRRRPKTSRRAARMSPPRTRDRAAGVAADHPRVAATEDAVFPLLLRATGTGEARVVIRVRLSPEVTLLDTLRAVVEDGNTAVMEFRDLGYAADTLRLTQGWPTRLEPVFAVAGREQVPTEGAVRLLPAGAATPMLGKTLGVAGRVVVTSQPGVFRAVVTAGLPPQVGVRTDTVVLKVGPGEPPRFSFDDLTDADTLVMVRGQVRTITVSLETPEPAAALSPTVGLSLGDYQEDGRTLPPLLVSPVPLSDSRFDVRALVAGTAALCPTLSFLPDDAAQLRGRCLNVRVREP